MVLYVLRITYKDQVRVISGDSKELTFDLLTKKVFRYFPSLSPHFTLKYDDEGPGLVTISTDEELIQATEMLEVLNRSRGCLPMFLFDERSSNFESGIYPQSSSFDLSQVEETEFECPEIDTNCLSTEEIEAQIRELEDRAYFETEERRKKASVLSESADALRWEAQYLTSKASVLLRGNEDIHRQVKFAVDEARRMIHRRNVRRILFERQQAKAKENFENAKEKLDEGLDNWYGGKEARSVNPFCTSSVDEDIHNIPTETLEDIYRSQGRSFCLNDPFEDEEKEEADQEHQPTELDSQYSQEEQWEVEEEKEESDQEDDSEEEENYQIEFTHNNDFCDEYYEYYTQLDNSQLGCEDPFESNYYHDGLPSLDASSLAASCLTIDQEEDDDTEIDEQIEAEDDFEPQAEVHYSTNNETEDDLLDFKEEQLVVKREKEEEEEKIDLPVKSEAIEIKKIEQTISPALSPLTSPQRDRRDNGSSPKKPFLFNFLSSIFDTKASQKAKEIANVITVHTNEPEKVREESLKMDDLESSNASYESSSDNYQSGSEIVSANESLDDTFGSEVAFPPASSPQDVQSFEETNTQVLYEQPPQSQTRELYASSLQLLNEMGWKDTEKNDLLLEKYRGDISEVIRELLEM
eukprot:TRINITY_DN1061_c0_g1_i1.p1 TRINITY_DN1061_c0_g1~~TRINITY_DN1061_c0_g1_i1.p1  ORF type:complete len:638 (-),score=227.67 TRINITY_DN1061_c0_g1_i1:88-2001(-)